MPPSTSAVGCVSRSRFSRALGIAGALLVVVFISGCLESESEGVDKIGRYEFHDVGSGIEIRERSTGLSRLLDALFGRTSQVKIRLGAFPGGEPNYAPNEIGEVRVRKRRLKGPAAKPTATRRPFEVRLARPEGGELPPFFYFRSEGEANEFARRIEILLGREA